MEHLEELLLAHDKFLLILTINRHVILPVFTGILVFLDKPFKIFIGWDLRKNDVKVRWFR